MSILEISDQNLYLHTERGFLLLSKGQQDIAQIDLDHLTAIIAKAYGLTYSQNLLVKLAKRNIALIITDSSYMPVSILQPIAVHHAPVPVLAGQIAATLGQNNLFWQKLVQAKVKMQVAVLDKLNIKHSLQNIENKVRAGDSSNIEAQVARKYWTLLFGEHFRRQQNGDAPNHLLNYGYIILRSAVAREVCATGLHPSIGIHHKHRQNAFCLTDDLIEPFRPLVDYTVYQLMARQQLELTQETKKVLVNILEKPLKVGTKWQTTAKAIQILAQSLAQIYLKNRQTLKIPKPILSRI